MAKPHHILLLALFVLWPQTGLATIYKCVDSSGGVRFTDTLESKLCAPVSLRGNGSAIAKEKVVPDNATLKSRAAKYEKIIHYYGVRYNIDPNLIRAVIRTESAFNAKAVSHRGAIGLMQLMPATAKELEVSDPFDPEQNIKGGTRYLRSLLNTFEQDLRLALAAYNAGPTIVLKEMAVPRFPETVEYIKRVLTYYQQYRKGRKITPDRSIAEIIAQGRDF